MTGVCPDGNPVKPIPQSIDLNPLVGEVRAVLVTPTDRETFPDTQRRSNAASGVALRLRRVGQAQVDLGVVEETESRLRPPPQDAPIRAVGVGPANSELLQLINMPVSMPVPSIEGPGVRGRNRDTPIRAIRSIYPLLQAHPRVRSTRTRTSQIELPVPAFVMIVVNRRRFSVVVF